MPTGGIPIGRLFGISLMLHYSWFFIFALVTWVLITTYFPIAYPDWSLTTSIIASLVASLLFFSSVLAHEMMHSIVARSSGIPVKSITLFIFGGVAQISEEPREPKVELRIALAGPLASIVLGGIFIGIWLILPARFEEVTAIAFWLGWINLVLAGFNLLPGFPLDGGRVLRSILWWRSGNLRRATKWASNAGRGLGFAFIFGGILLVFFGFWLNGVWLAFIGWFLINAAARSYKQVALQHMLQGYTVREIMNRDCLTVPPDITIDKLVSEYILPSGNRCLVVATGSRMQGLITLQNIRAFPRRQWADKKVAEAMTPLDRIKRVQPDDDLASVLKILTEQDINQLPVVEDGNIIGMVGRDNLLSFMNARNRLGI
ncbi:MAG: site-2 protease family protein [Dehalococcoidales bacterium]|nr:site-2 protease family protein [Dehalococcoidales bacterium]